MYENLQLKGCAFSLSAASKHCPTRKVMGPSRIENWASLELLKKFATKLSTKTQYTAVFQKRGNQYETTQAEFWYYLSLGGGVPRWTTRPIWAEGPSGALSAPLVESHCYSHGYITFATWLSWPKTVCGYDALIRTAASTFASEELTRIGRKVYMLRSVEQFSLLDANTLEGGSTG
jgi:hypothetical protein